MIVDQFGKNIKSRPSAQGYGGGMDWAFDAASRRGYRGWFWFPSLDPGVQLTQWTRVQLARKVNWLYNNIGAVRAVIDGLALDEVDSGLWPKPATKSAAFNAAVKHAWQQQCGFHKAFSADGENNFYSAQYLVRREIRLRGDCFGLKLRAGENAACPQMQFIPSWQCDNALTMPNEGVWRDGRLDNKLGRPLKWRFLDTGDNSAWRVNPSQKYTDAPASDVIHFHDPFLMGQKRGISALAPVARKLFSIDDIERAETSGVLLRTRLAYAIERADEDTTPTLLPGVRETEVVNNPDGSKLLIQKIVANDGTEVDVADLPAGKKLKVVESTKTSESGGWIKELLADVAYTTLYPPTYIFSLADLAQGTQVRLAQTKVQRVINTVRDFQIILQMLEEWWPFWLWQNIRAGTFDNVRGGIPDEWWPYLVVRPKDMTVDVGREGKLYDERVSTGKMPVGLYVGMLYGEDEEDFDERVVRDRARRKKLVERISQEEGVELNVDEVFRLPPGTDATITANTSAPTPDDDPDDQTVKK